MKYVSPDIDIKIFSTERIGTEQYNMSYVPESEHSSTTITLKDKLKASAEKTANIVVFRWK